MPKHYYIESERVTTKLGGGFQPAPLNPMTDHVQYPIGKDYANLAEELWNRLQYTEECTGLNPNYVTGEHNNLLYAFDLWVGMDNYESNAFYYHSDHLGSSSLITDASGNLDQHYQYLPFGEPFVSQKLNTGVRFTFSGKERDSETNLSYFGARYYSSDVSVWLSVDPLSDKYPSLSPYAYVANNPILFVDPDGRSFTEFKNKKTGESITIEDGMDQTVHVNNEDWQTVEKFENEVDGNNPMPNYNSFIEKNGGVPVPTKSQGGYIPSKSMAMSFLIFKARKEDNEVACFEVKDENSQGFIVQPWEDNSPFSSYNNRDITKDYGYSPHSIVAQYHTHPKRYVINPGLSPGDVHKSIIWNGMKVNAVYPTGEIYGGSWTMQDVPIIKNVYNVYGQKVD